MKAISLNMEANVGTSVLVTIMLMDTVQQELKNLH